MEGLTPEVVHAFGEEAMRLGRPLIGGILVAWVTVAFCRAYAARASKK